MNSNDASGPGPRASGGTIGFAVALVVLALIIALVLFARQPGGPPPVSSAPGTVPPVKAGETKHIGNAAAIMGIACLPTRQKFEEMLAAGRANDDKKLQASIADAAILHPEDAVRIVERFGPSGKYAKLQLESGGYAGRTCFTEIDAPDFLQ